LKRGGEKLKYGLLSLGLIITIIFGGGFLIRLVRDGEFYLAEFMGGIIGILVMIAVLFMKGSMKPNNIF